MPSTGSSTGAAINNETGEITFNSAVAGSWASCVKIEEWRCGQLIGEIYRDIPIVTVACTPLYRTMFVNIRKFTSKP